MMRESDILFETDDHSHWVSRNMRDRGGYVVWRVGATHSTACAWIGFEGQLGLDKAIAEAKRRAALPPKRA